MSPADHGTPNCIAHRALIAFDIQLDTGVEAVFGAVQVVIGADHLVVSDGQEGAAEGVEMGRGGRVGVGGGLLRQPPVPAAPSAPPLPLARARSAMAGAGGLARQVLEIAGALSGSTDDRSPVVVVGRRRHGVVDVPGGLLPRIEHHLFVGVVGVQRGDDALDRVVEQDRADADLHAELEAVRICAWLLKNGSYWRTGLPLLLKMVQPLPTQRGGPATPFTSLRLGLDLLLDLAAKAVGVGKAVLDLQALRLRKGALAWVSRARVAAQTGCHWVGSFGFAC